MLNRLVGITTGVTLAALLLAAGPAPKTKGKTWLTYPMPPKIMPSDPMRIFPGFEVPDRPERFAWKVTAPKNEPNLKVVPVFSFAGGRMAKVGNVPLGVSLQLTEFRAVGRSHYYPIKFTPEGGTEQIAWVSGMYVAPSKL